MNVVTTIIKSRHSVRKFKFEPIDEKSSEQLKERVIYYLTANYFKAIDETNTEN